ncbi:hypothetical protein [Thermoproteus tenax]|uniref:Uncharacterized conserved protein n=1 Tax=Thermoproteus tenax (strain ATCC 35583 / DSM 2078 / JCM 9277 / NBRC 100435 / Kra 1) TaxID=768679 RepID=G4RK21_THETK|nr:hypothetical protein [Thermoproteus tenax]CCC81916.1 Uncharacterized conserved protein [Thermoproteus tenax Kra 1]
MAPKYARLAVEKGLAEELSKRLKKIGRRYTDVVTALVRAALDLVDHGVDPVDVPHVCRIARALGLGRGGYEVGLKAGALLRAYYGPAEFLDVMTRVGPQIFGVHRAGNAFRSSDAAILATIKGLMDGVGCRTEQAEDILYVDCGLSSA